MTRTCPSELFPGEEEPIAQDPILRGVDLALVRLIRRDCFTMRTVRILDELRAEIIGVPSSAELRAHYAPLEDIDPAELPGHDDWKKD